MNTKILLFDIETAPHLAWVWKLYDTNVINVEEYGYMLSFAYKWYGDKKVKAFSLPDFKGYKKNKKDDKQLCLKLWELFNQADIVIGHNGVAFDVKTAQGRFFIHGLKPPIPFKQVDTLKEARKNFKLPSNKLDDIVRMLEFGRKVPHEGFDMWKGCMNGDKKYWKKMVKYNIHDVKLLNDVYEEMRPWVNNHPNLNVLNGTEDKCPRCSGNVQKRGFAITRTTKHQRLQCQKCGGWSQKPLRSGIVR